MTKELTAKIEIEDLTFKAIADFQNDLTKVNRYIKKLTKDGISFKMTICVAQYDYADWETRKEIKTKSFDWWEFNGLNDCPSDDSEIGVYLQPDTRYTNAEHDVWYDFTLESLPQY